MTREESGLFGTPAALRTDMQHHLDDMSPKAFIAAGGSRRGLKLALLSALAILGFFILREHWSHALGLAPYLLLLACPLMHLFGHGHRRSDGDEHRKT
jgi:hypothetical protein